MKLTTSLSDQNPCTKSDACRHGALLYRPVAALNSESVQHQPKSGIVGIAAGVHQSNCRSQCLLDKAAKRSGLSIVTKRLAGAKPGVGCGKQDPHSVERYLKHRCAGKCGFAVTWRNVAYQRTGALKGALANANRTPHQVQHFETTVFQALGPGMWILFICELFVGIDQPLDSRFYCPKALRHREGRLKSPRTRFAPSLLGFSPTTDADVKKRSTNHCQTTEESQDAGDQRLVVIDKPPTTVHQSAPRIHSRCPRPQSVRAILRAGGVLGKPGETSAP